MGRLSSSPNSHEKYATQKRESSFRRSHHVLRERSRSISSSTLATSSLGVRCQSSSSDSSARSAVGLWSSAAKRAGSSAAKISRAPRSQLNQRFPAISRSASRRAAADSRSVMGAGKLGGSSGRNRSSLAAGSTANFEEPGEL